jgi:hypothetical protein
MRIHRRVVGRGVHGQVLVEVNKNHASIWQPHGWYWGLAFCDPIL